MWRRRPRRVGGAEAHGHYKSRGAARGSRRSSAVVAVSAGLRAVSGSRARRGAAGAAPARAALPGRHGSLRGPAAHEQAAGSGGVAGAARRGPGLGRGAEPAGGSGAGPGRVPESPSERVVTPGWGEWSRAGSFFGSVFVCRREERRRRRCQEVCPRGGAAPAGDFLKLQEISA